MFIRTKDIVYKVLNMKTYCGKKFYYVGNEMVIPDDKVIKQTKTIECDEFVYEKQGYDLPQRCYQNCRGVWFDEQAIYILNEQEISTIKGAIWTDKGLIYVAKMNDEGEMELI